MRSDTYAPGKPGADRDMDEYDEIVRGEIPKAFERRAEELRAERERDGARAPSISPRPRPLALALALAAGSAPSPAASPTGAAQAVAACCFLKQLLLWPTAALSLLRFLSFASDARLVAPANVAEHLLLRGPPVGLVALVACPPKAMTTGFAGVGASFVVDARKRRLSLTRSSNP